MCAENWKKKKCTLMNRLSNHRDCRTDDINGFSYLNFKFYGTTNAGQATEVPRQRSCTHTTGWFGSNPRRCHGTGLYGRSCMYKSEELTGFIKSEESY